MNSAYGSYIIFPGYRREETPMVIPRVPATFEDKAALHLIKSLGERAFGYHQVNGSQYEIGE